METDRMSVSSLLDNSLGAYLKDRRRRLDPSAFGFSLMRRRTPGLRREEVAQLANVSATWYTWLEQGRGGSASVDVLDRISEALALDEVEREHLFFLAQLRAPRIEHLPFDGVTPQFQRMLDSLELSPAYVKTPSWDVIAWNDAAAAVLSDYGALAPVQRNILRLLFCDRRVRAAMVNWEDDARFAVAAFRTEIARNAASESVDALVDELRRSSREFDSIWRDYAVRNFGEGLKRLRHPEAGAITLEYSSFAVDGRVDLGLVIYTPASTADRERIRMLTAIRAKADRGEPIESQTKST